MGKREFQECLEETARKFRNIPESEDIKVVSNLDADGISACAIMVRALQRLGRKYSVRIVHQLRDKELLELAEEDYDYYVFTDVGSGVLDWIDKILKDRQVLVLDHHHPEGSAENVWHVNPHLFGIDGSSQVSASGVTFMFCRTLDKSNEDMAHIALVGAIGDVQEDDGFEGLNHEILEIALENGVVEVRKGLNLYGKEGRPIHKLLEYGSDMDIPGVTGSESGAVQFLKSMGIEPQKDGKWRFLNDLTEKERKSLVTGIIMRRSDKEDPENVFCNVYTIPGEEGLFRNLKEFSTLLNACGRMDRASIGVGACLGKKKFKKKALKVYSEYKQEIVGAMRWFERNMESDKVIQGDGYIIINAKGEILNTIIGTLISIVSKSWNFSKGTILLSMARKPDKLTKVSIRVVGNPEGLHLRDVIGEIVEKVDGEYGGHQYAAGAVIPTEKEDEFIEAAEKVLQGIK